MKINCIFFEHFKKSATIAEKCRYDGEKWRWQMAIHKSLDVIFDRNQKNDKCFFDRLLYKGLYEVVS